MYIFPPYGKCQPLEAIEYRFIIILPPDPDSFPPFSEETALLAPEAREVSESFKEKHIHRATIQTKWSSKQQHTQCCERKK